MYEKSCWKLTSVVRRAMNETKKKDNPLRNYLSNYEKIISKVAYQRIYKGLKFVDQSECGLFCTKKIEMERISHYRGTF